MAPTPSSKSNLLKTPQSNKRLHYHPTKTNQTPNPNSGIKVLQQTEHPVEVIGRIRDYPDRKEKPVSVLQINPDSQNVRVRADFGYRDFALDGVSLSEEEDIETFYKKFVKSRIDGVMSGEKCTIMMYGPTGSGKSHTMFGCSKQPGIVYRSLKDILGEDEDEGDQESIGLRFGMFVQVTVLEIYNEEIYDLLSSNGGGGGGSGLGWPKGSASKVKLEVMGKKAKNATYISGNEAGKISKEIQKVEKRRIVRSTLCNDRSSRSHCMIILDVPTVGGRLMLVDMAGSENIDQAGQIGFEAKMQTGKINQGNIALKRVVESIANADSHVPFRDSKLTMLLQDSFEDDKSKILMILCASPDPKEIHKTISTLEYGAKAKCIVRGPHTPMKDKNGAEDSTSTVILGSRIQVMDEFIYKLQKDNKIKERERNEAQKEISKKEKEIAALRARLEVMEAKGVGRNEEDINMKVNEQIQVVKLELEKKLKDYQRMADDFVELERRKMEEKMMQQQKEVETFRKRLREIEYELIESGVKEMDGGRLAKRLMGVYSSADAGMVKSMDLDMDDQGPSTHEVKLVDVANSNSFLDKLNREVSDRVGLSTVLEEEEEEEEDKEVIEEKRVVSIIDGLPETSFDKEESAFSRRLRIQNIFTLCGINRELSQQIQVPKKSPVKIIGKENYDPEIDSRVDEHFELHAK